MVLFNIDLYRIYLRLPYRQKKSLNYAKKPCFRAYLPLKTVLLLLIEFYDEIIGI